MNRQNEFSIILFSLLCTLFVSCSKDERPMIDEEAPQISILSPKADTYSPGALVQLNVEITENLELHEYKIQLIPKELNTQLTIAAGHSHEQYLLIEKQFELPNLGSSMTLVVEAEDHDGNIGREEMTLFIH